MSGAMFETWTITEIIKSYLHNGRSPRIYFYRDKDKREIDLLIEESGTLYPIERLWRSLKYECVYLSAFETGSQARAGIGRWIEFYNHRRPHSAHGVRTPAEAYAQSLALQKGCKNVEENYAIAA